ADGLTRGGGGAEGADDLGTAGGGIAHRRGARRTGGEDTRPDRSCSASGQAPPYLLGRLRPCPMPRSLRSLALALLLAGSGPAAAQHSGLGYRMDELDLAVFEAAPTPEAEGAVPLPPRAAAPAP